MSVFSNLLWDKPASSTTYDVRSPVQAVSEKERLGVGEGLTNQYAAASGDPNFGITGGRPSDALNRYLMDNAETDEVNRIAASGGGGSGYSASRAAKAATDAYFSRQNALSQTQNQARNNVGQMMVNATNPSGYTPYQSFQNPAKPSILSSLVNGVVGGGAGGAGSAAGGQAGGMLGGMMGGGGGGAGAALALKDGGVVTHPTLALVGEEGPEKVTPLHSKKQVHSAAKHGMRVY